MLLPSGTTVASKFCQIFITRQLKPVVGPHKDFLSCLSFFLRRRRRAYVFRFVNSNILATKSEICLSGVARNKGCSNEEPVRMYIFI